MNRLRHASVRRAASVLGCALGLVLSSLAVLSAAQQSEASRKALESAAAKGSVPAQYALGAGAEADGDFARAASWYRQAADNGYAAAQFRLGQLLENGQGVPPDTAEALEWYRKAAAQNVAAAIGRLQVLDRSSVSPPVQDQRNIPAPPISVGAPRPHVQSEPSLNPPPNPSSISPPAQEYRNVPAPPISVGAPTPQIQTESPPNAPSNQSAVPAANPKSDSDNNSGILATFGAFIVLLALAALALYFLPTIIAFVRGHRNRWVIGVLNLVFGFTVVGWILPLVWACNKFDDPVKGGVKYDPQPYDPIV